MAIKLPARNFFTFSELMTRWQCAENDLRSLLQESKLTPKFLITEGVFHMPDKNDYYLVQSGRMHDIETPLEESSLREWLYLKSPITTSIFDAYFPFCSDKRETKYPQDSEENNAKWFFLMPPVTLSDVIQSGIFDSDEIFNFEIINSTQDEILHLDEKPLPTTERNTLLKLVIGMAMEGYKYSPTALKSPVPKEIADDLNLLGINITDDTVRKHLKKASETVLPKKKRQP